MATRKRATARKTRSGRPRTATLEARVRRLERLALANAEWMEDAHAWIVSIDRFLHDIKRADPVPGKLPKVPIPKPGPGGAPG
ncbi:MAG TPA: hypothetical protein PLL69_09310 [Gemmatimonadales bacterium]|nr:hypothetical protein [Gemmatimonadales bacterium]